MDRKPRTLHVFSFILVFALLLVACGGGDDDDDDADTAGSNAATATSGGGTSATDASPTSAAEATQPASSGGGDLPAGAPTPEDPNFPDVFAKLEVGAVAEVDTGDDLNQVPGRTRVTIDNIRAGVEPVSQFYELQPGFTLWAVDVTIESTGEGGIPLPNVTLQTADGTSYEWVGGSDLGSTPLFIELPSGQSIQGVYVFEIPEDATIQWLLWEPSIYVGRNIVFLP